MKYFSIIILFLSNFINGQTANSYLRQYDSLTLLGDYVSAIKTPYYSNLHSKKTISNFYNLACINAKLGKTDSAFAFLNNSLKFNSEFKFNILVDEDFNSLKNDIRWTPIYDTIYNELRHKFKSNTSLNCKYFLLCKKDAHYRTGWARALEIFGPNSETANKIHEFNDQIDSINKIEFYKLFDSIKKWPGTDIFDQSVSHFIILLYLHQECSFMTKHYKDITLAFMNNEITSKEFASCTDRHNLFCLKTNQIYGTQFIKDANGKLKLDRANTIDEINKARASINMELYKER